MVDAQTVGVLVTAASVTVAAIYYILTLRTNQRNLKMNLETRQTQLFMQVFQRFQEPDFTKQWNLLMNREWKDLDDYRKKYSDPGPDGASLLSVQTYFEGVAVLLMKGMIDVDLVYELMPTMVTTFWKKYEPLVRLRRDEINYPQYFRPVEYLSDRMVEHAHMRGDPVLFSYTSKQDVW